MSRKADIVIKDDQEYVETEDHLFGLGLQLPAVKAQLMPSLGEFTEILSWEQIRKIVDSEEFEFGRRMFDSSWITNQNGFGSCFPAGTLVRMADGTQKPIEKIQCLDSVVTAEGNTGNVLCVQARQHKGEIVTLKLWGHRHLKATEEHPILTKSGYKPIGDLTKDDWVAIPKYHAMSSNVIVPEEYCEKPWRMLKESTESPRGLGGKTQVKIKRTPVPATIRLSYSFGRIVGLFLAEGSTSHGKVVFTLAKEEFETLGKELENLFLNLFGVTVSRVIRNNKTIVRVYGSNWVDLFQSICAEGCANKRIHKDLWSGPNEFLQGVLSGWESGDGLGPDIRGGTTVSHALALDMFNVANILGFMPTISTRQPKVSHGVKSRRRRYDVSWTCNAEEDAQSRKWRCQQDKRVMWRRVAGTERTAFSGMVFNLEVEGDHSYVAEGVGVHNCAGYAGASALAKSRVINGQQRVDLSGDYLYSLTNGGRDQGSMLDDNMIAMMTRGVASAETVPLGGIFPSKYNKSQADAEALRFRAHEAFAISDEQSMATALALRIPVVIAIHVTNSWRQFDGDDYLSPRNDGPGNHSEHCDDLRYNSKKGRFEYRKATSHGTNYSDDGYCWTGWEDHYKTPSRYHQFYAVPSATQDPQGDNPAGTEQEVQPMTHPILTVQTSDNCVWCRRWKQTELPQVEQAGYKVMSGQVANEGVPAFKLRVNGQEYIRVGFWKFTDIALQVAKMR